VDGSDGNPIGKESPIYARDALILPFPALAISNSRCVRTCSIKTGRGGCREQTDKTSLSPEGGAVATVGCG